MDFQNKNFSFIRLVFPVLLLGTLVIFSTSCSTDSSSSNDGTATTTSTNSTSTSATGTSDNTTATTASGSSYSIKDGNLVDGSGAIVKSLSELFVDENGNITDKAGNIIARAGSYSGAVSSLPKLDASVVSQTASDLGDKTQEAMEGLAVLHVDEATGNLVDENGKVILEKGKFEQDEEGYFVNKETGKRIGFFKKVGQAIAKAAGATADALKNTFSALFKKKKSGEEVTAYTLSDLEFNTDPTKPNLIKKYSVAEVQGLANALKEDKDAKIEVHAYTADGNNKSLSQKRADLITQQLTTLGVSKKQISAKGMGDKDAAKAAANTIEIIVK